MNGIERVALTGACALVVACSGKPPWAASGGDRDAGPKAGHGTVAAHDDPVAAPAVDLYGQALPSGAVARLGTLELRHSARALAWSPDGKLIASVGGNPSRQSLVVFASDSGMPVWRYAPGSRQGMLGFEGVAFSPDGKMVLAHGIGAAPLVILDASTGNLLHEIRPTAKIAADLYDDEPVEQQMPVYAAGFTPDGKRLAAMCADRAIHVWDVTGHTPEEIGRIQAGPLRGPDSCSCDSDIWTLAISPDGATAAYGDLDDNLTMVALGDYEGKQGKPRKLGKHSKDVNHVVFSEDGRFLASASEDGVVKVWNTATGKQVTTLGSKWDYVDSLDFSPDGRYLAVSISIGLVKVIDTSNWKSAPGLDGIHGGALAFSPDSGRLAIAKASNKIDLVDMASGKQPPPRTEGARRSITGVALSPDGLVAYAISKDRTLRGWEIRTGKQKLVAPIEGCDCRAIAASADSETIAVSAFKPEDPMKAHPILLLDSATGKSKGKLEGHGTPAAGLVFTHDGAELISSDGFMVVVWNIGTGKASGNIMPALYTLDDFIGERVWLPLTGDDGILGYSNGGSTALLWDLEKGEVVESIKGLRRAGAMAVTGDGRTVALSGGDDRLEIRRFDPDGSVVLSYPVERATIDLVALSPDGDLVAASGSDGGIRVWKASAEEGGAPLMSFAGHDGPITALVFTPDGKLLLSGSTDTTILVWDVSAA